ncbi:hypothetical protein C8R44DRAFT_891416 [Mycena epipterygia]|nr:hypothetical protein C8R44DRAFT_891416 [Mycena epipterygia]
MSQKAYHTRAATRDGVYPPPKPLYSPLAFGSIELGAEEFPLIDLSTGAAARLVARPSLVSARDAPVLVAGSVPGASRAGEIPGASRARNLPYGQSAGGDSSSLPLLTQSNLAASLTSHSHRERKTSNGSRVTSNNNSVRAPSEPEYESTMELAANEMTEENLQVLVRRYESMANFYHAKLQRKVVSKSYQQVESVSDNNAPDSQADTPRSNGSILRADVLPTPPVNAAPKFRKATIEEVEDEGDLLSFSPAAQAGPSHDKGKGPDPGNWGDVGALQGFTERDLRAQQEALLNFEEINRINREDERSSPNIIAEFLPAKTSSPKTKERPSRKRSKSPTKSRTRTRKAVEPVEVARPISPAAKARPRVVEPKKSKDLPSASDHGEDSDRESTSGPSVKEMFQLLNSTIIKLEETQKQFTQLSSRRDEAPVLPARE